MNFQDLENLVEQGPAREVAPTELRPGLRERLTGKARAENIVLGDQAPHATNIAVDYPLRIVRPLAIEVALV